MGSIGVAANLFLTYLILLAALRFVGVSATELSAAEAFAAFAVAFWAGAVFPITGSGLGVVDAVLIAMLVELGSASDDTLLAATLLWRVFYSVVTLPLGAITLSRYRKATPTCWSAERRRPFRTEARARSWEARTQPAQRINASPACPNCLACRSSASARAAGAAPGPASMNSSAKRRLRSPGSWTRSSWQ